MGVQKPKQAQERDEDNLADERIAVDEEGDGTANNGRFDQIKNCHMTVFKLRPVTRRPAARLTDKANV